MVDMIEVKQLPKFAIIVSREEAAWLYADLKHNAPSNTRTESPASSSTRKAFKDALLPSIKPPASD